jgi:hypothetical protein
MMSERSIGRYPGYPVVFAVPGCVTNPVSVMPESSIRSTSAPDCGASGYARRLAKERALYAVIGGFHLNGPIFEPLIPRVLDDLGALAPSVLVPAHCTGWRAQHAMGARFGEAFIPNTVGTRLEL